MHFKISIILLAVLTGGALGACKRSASKLSPEVESIVKSDTIPAEVKRLVRVVSEDDSTGFAKLVSYPLQRPYPLHDINNEEEMKDYYHKLVDDSLRNILTHSGPGHWNSNGWKGWSLDDGSYVWVDDHVYAVNYVSAREKQLMDSLRTAEIAGIAPQIREGWQPELCLADASTGTVYRIDSRRRSANATTCPHPYRLAIYAPDSDLRGIPASLLEGEVEVEGTTQNVLYRFHRDGREDLVIEPDSPELGPVLYAASDSALSLKRTYWHTLLDSIAGK